MRFSMTHNGQVYDFSDSASHGYFTVSHNVEVCLDYEPPSEPGGFGYSDTRDCFVRLGTISTNHNGWEYGLSAKTAHNNDRAVVETLNEALAFLVDNYAECRHENCFREEGKDWECEDCGAWLPNIDL